MSDPLSAYHAEIRAVEDAWFEELYAKYKRTGEKVDSLWQSDWNLLREIDERHGIRPDDLRVYSIAAYRLEFAAIKSDWDRECWERLKIIRADPEADPPYGMELYRYENRRENCLARHFPRMDFLNAEFTATTIPKAWYSITNSLENLEFLKLTEYGRANLDGASKKWAEIAYSLLLHLGIPWALDPRDYPTDFSGKQYRDQLRHFANRLEREEAEALPSELRRAFAVGSPDCGRMERLEFHKVESDASPATPEAMPGKSKGIKPPSRDAFAAYHLYKMASMNQKQVARTLAKETRKPIDQSWVSRNIKKVEEWLGEGNKLPTPEMISMDPSRLDLGPKGRGNSRSEYDEGG